MAYIAKKFNESVSVEQAFLQELGLHVHAGQQIVCPFHADKTPSMKVYGGERGAYCFGQCGRTYTAFSVVKHQHDDLSYPDLLDYIQQTYQVTPPTDDEDSGSTTSVDSLIAQEYSNLEGYVAFDNIRKFELAITYLIDKHSSKYWDKLLAEINGISADSVVSL